LILQEVQTNGANPSTWAKLAQKLNRIRPGAVQVRYNNLATGMGFSHKKMWTLGEDEITLRHFFEGKTDSGVENIKSIGLRHFKPLEAVLGRYLKI
jgi:hypothetical protein